MKNQVTALQAQLDLLIAIYEAAQQTLYNSSDDAKAKLSGTIDAYHGYLGEEEPPSPGP